MPFPFSSLASELRHKVWEMATIEEASSRSVFVHQCPVNLTGTSASWERDYRVKPAQRLKSAIMSVCYESRSRALTIYTLQLDVAFDLRSAIQVDDSPVNGTPARMPCHGPAYGCKGKIYCEYIPDLSPG